MNYLHQIPVIISAEVIILPLNLPVKLGDWVVLVLVCFSHLKECKN